MLGEPLTLPLEETCTVGRREVLQDRRCHRGTVATERRAGQGDPVLRSTGAYSSGPLIRAMVERVGLVPTIDGLVGWDATR